MFLMFHHILKVMKLNYIVTLINLHLSVATGILDPLPSNIIPPPQKVYKQRSSSGKIDVGNNDLDNIQSCGSCCYTIESAKAPLDVSFFAKQISVRNFTVASSSQVHDQALYESALVIDFMTQKRPDILQLLVDEGIIHVVMGIHEVVTDIPQYSSLDSSWDQFRGLGPTWGYPASSNAEENVLCLPEDPYFGEQNILVHEFAHAIHGEGLRLPRTRTLGGNQNLNDYLQFLFQKNSRLWANTYAATDHREYFATAVQAFYNTLHEGPKGGDGVYSDINNRTELKNVDPELYEVVKQIIGESARFSDVHCPSRQCNCAKFLCPGEKPPPIAFCFSGHSVVYVKGKGAVLMAELQIEDEILVDADNYEPVYAFGHRDESMETNFVQFLPSMLEMTGNHMVYVMEHGYIPASTVKVGHCFSEDICVKEIRHVVHQGVFAPFTPSGTIVVNGVQSSNYIAFQASRNLFVFGWRTPLTHQSLAHYVVKFLRTLLLFYTHQEWSEFLIWSHTSVIWIFSEDGTFVNAEVLIFLGFAILFAMVRWLLFLSDRDTKASAPTATQKQLNKKHLTSVVNDGANAVVVL